MSHHIEREREKVSFLWAARFNNFCFATMTDLPLRSFHRMHIAFDLFQLRDRGRLSLFEKTAGVLISVNCWDPS